MKFLNFLLNLAVSLLIILVLASSIRGNYGAPTSKDLLDQSWSKNGPFELSPERGRFGLAYSIFEDRSLFFTTDIARFIVPDLGYKNGNYVSLFAPGVSYLILPGYFLGNYFDLTQVGSYAIIGIFALLNLFIIKKIVTGLGASNVAGWISGMIFLFATPAYAYAVNLYQHHISTFLILLSILIVIRSKKTWPLFFVWFLCAMSIPVDYPNLFLMFPVGVYSLSKIIEIKKDKKYININLKWLSFITFLGLIPPIIFFTWFNSRSYGDPMQFSGTVETVLTIDKNGKPVSAKPTNIETTEKKAVNFFKSRNILNGLYIHFVSPDRGIIYFTPIILLGLFGIYVLYRNNNDYLSMLLGIIFANVTLYSMWGDPWGGWGFGSRYLIPSYAIMSIFIGVALSEFKRKWLFLTMFYIVMIYSVLVNTLGALTTSSNPPKIEVLSLEKASGKRERYSYDRNWEYLTSGKSKSFVFRTWGKNYVDSVNYYYIISGLIMLTLTTLLVIEILKKHETKK